MILFIFHENIYSGPWSGLPWRHKALFKGITYGYIENERNLIIKTHSDMEL